MKYINHFFTSLFLTCFLIFPCSFSAGAMKNEPQQISVQEMFKDLTEEQIVAYMEEGQREMERIMTSGTPEEQQEFYKMMEETMKNFSEEDFQEINKIAQIVEPLLAEKEAEVIKQKESQITKAQSAKVDTKKDMASGDTSLQYLLHKMNKTINSILLKVKSDTSLTTILKQWDSKDTFNELVRLLQALNNKNLIAQLIAPTSDDIKKLVETIENFEKRLEIENKQFNVADTFGLEVDKATSAENAEKLLKILDFFNGATQTLLPMITKFIQEFEPEALKLAKAHDDKAQASLEAAKQIEKLKRPLGNYTGSDRIPSTGSSLYNQQDMYAGHNDYNGSQNYSNASPQNRRAQNKMNSNAAAVSSQAPQNTNPSAAPKAPADKSVKKEDDKKDADKKAPDTLKPIINDINRFDDMFDNNSFDDYRKTLIAAGNTYQSFGKELFINDTDYQTILHPQFRGPLTIDQSNLKSNFQQKSVEFPKAIKSAHTYYGDLKNSIENIKPQINQIKSILDSTKGKLSTLTLQDLENLSKSPALKKLKSRFQSYELIFSNVQKELKNKHKAHKIETGNSDETKAYNELFAKVESLYGLDRIILDTKSSFDLFDRAIKAEIKQRKRDAGQIK